MLSFARALDPFHISVLLHISVFSWSISCLRLLYDFVNVNLTLRFRPFKIYFNFWTYKMISWKLDKVFCCKWIVLMFFRFVFVTPSVISPAVSLRVSHPSPSSESNLHWLETRLRPEILKSSALLHPIQSRTSVTFPELRLIQYDCGEKSIQQIVNLKLKVLQY